eukprot:PhF_6_TR32991/c0_g1_i1/m.48596/K14165/K14165; atypical dual specificity phosphatase
MEAAAAEWKTEGLYHVWGGLFISSYRTTTNIDLLRKANITTIVNLSDASDQKPSPQQAEFHVVHYPIPDSSKFDLKAHLPKLCGDIAAEILPPVNKRVVVNCSAGQSRSASVVLATLVLCYRETGMDLNTAFKHLQRVKHDVRPNQGFMAQLVSWEIDVLTRPTPPGASTLYDTIHKVRGGGAVERHHQGSVDLHEYLVDSLCDIFQQCSREDVERECQRCNWDGEKAQSNLFQKEFND